MKATAVIMILALLVAIGVALAVREQAIQMQARLPGRATSDIPIWNCATESSGVGRCSLSWPIVSTSSVRYHAERAASCFFERGKPKDQDGTICAPSLQACELLRNARQRLPNAGEITECEIVDLGDLTWHRRGGGLVAIMIAVGGVFVGLVLLVPIWRFERRQRRRSRNVDRWR
jgi:hypothetical protein